MDEVAAITAYDIEREHRAALDSLTFEQTQALARVQRAVQISHFNHHRLVENLQKIFQEEAERRNAGASRRERTAIAQVGN